MNGLDPSFWICTRTGFDWTADCPGQVWTSGAVCRRVAHGDYDRPDARSALSPVAEFHGSSFSCHGREVAGPPGGRPAMNRCSDLDSSRGRFRRLLAYRSLVKYLVLKEIKVRSRGTYLGVAWTLMNPLLTIVMYFVVFQYIFLVNIPNFLAFFLVGFLMWVFFSRAVSAAATCILDNEAIIKKSAFPLETLPLAVILHHLFHHVVALAIALPLMLAFWGAKLSMNLLWVAVVLTAFVCFTLAVALWLSTIGLFFRDARDILDVGLPILMWATPIFYAPEMAPPVLRPVLIANPLSSFIGAVRAALLGGQRPSRFHLTLIGLWTAGAFLTGMWLFARHSPRFAEEL